MNDGISGKTAKIDITIGKVAFSGEGESDWLATQLDKILKAAESHPAAMGEPINETIVENGTDGGGTPGGSTVGSLASFLKAKDAMSNQTKRFLATAGWLTKKGSTSLKTGDVSKALKDNHQSKLSNPSECLNKNVGKGFCEKTSDGFFVTPEGWKDLGEEQ